MLSIITNFGCDEGCLYCVWKKHLLENVKTTVESTDWTKLESLLRGEKRISVSGGGDPLFQLDKNIDWWNRLFAITDAQGIDVDLHTAKIAPVEFADKFAKYVWHITDLSAVDKLSLMASYSVPLRMAIVASPEITKAEYLALALLAFLRGASLSVRQLVVDQKPVEIEADFLKTEKGWKYIQQNDYNTYFMPDNNVYDVFLMKERK